MEYLLKVSAVVAIFYVCYKLFLQRDTFFEYNRWFLLFGLVTSFLVPFFIIPIYIEYVPTETAILNYETISVTNETEKSFNILDYFPLIYGLGVLCFLIRFLIQLSSLSVIIFKNESVKDGRYTFVKIDKNISPFSFFNWIVYNPTNFIQTDLDQIITHEKAHANQYHSIDILLTQLVNVVLWFNPIIWFYNKDLKQNLEFIADKTAQNKLKCKKSYQTILLKSSIPSHQMVLSNNFYNSLIKKRIVMLHKSKSKKVNLLKYVLVIPLLTLFLMSFNTKDIYIEKEVPSIESLNENISNSLLNESQPIIEEEEIEKKTEIVHPILNSTVKKSTKKPFQVIQEKTEVIINKKTTDNSLEKIKSLLKKQGFSAQFKGLKRNDEGEITAIKIKVTSEASNANYNISSDTPINPIVVLITEGGKNVSISNQTIVENKNEFIVTGRVSNNNVHFLQGTTITADTIQVEGINEINVVLKEQKSKGGKFKARLSRVKYEDSTKINIITDNGKDPIYIINGKELTKEEIKEISPDQIESVSVLKGENAEAKYGEKGKNGVVIIQKKKNSEVIVDLDNNENEIDEINEDEIIIVREDKNPSNFIIAGTGKKNKPLIIIDGKETKDKIDDLDRDDIKSINVLKGDSANKKYGKKGINGVIEIITKKTN